MKRAILVTIGLVVVAAIGWTGFWFWAKAQFETAFDDRLESLAAARGLVIAYESRETSGFPTQLAMTVTGVTVTTEQGTLEVALPKIGLDAALTDFGDGPITLTLPETTTVTLVRPGLEGDAPQTRSYTIVAEDRAGSLRPLDDGKQAIKVSAERLLISRIDADPADFADLELKDFVFESRSAPNIAVSSELRIGELVILMNTITDRLSPPRRVLVGLWVTGIAVDFQGRLPDQTDLELLFAGLERLAADFEVGQTEMEIQVIGTAPQDSGLMQLDLSRATGAIEIGDGMLDLKLDLRQFDAVLLPDVTAGRIHGGIGLAEAILGLRLPIAPGEEMLPFSASLSLTGLGGDEQFWQTLDPNGRLLRDPIGLKAAASGSTRVVSSLLSLRPGEAPPYRFGNVLIEKGEISALGARGKIEGDLEFLQPISLPQGILTVEARRVLDAIDQLVAAGILSATERDAAHGYLSYYTRQGETLDALLTELDFGPEGLKINGKPLPGF